MSAAGSSSRNTDDLGNPVSALPTERRVRVRTHKKICVECELALRRTERGAVLEGTEQEWEEATKAGIEEERRAGNRQEQHAWRGKFYKQAAAELSAPESEAAMTRKKLRHAKRERAHELLRSFLKTLVQGSFWEALRRAGSKMQAASIAWTKVEELGEMLRQVTDPQLRKELQESYDKALQEFDRQHEPDVFTDRPQAEAAKLYRACDPQQEQSVEELSTGRDVGNSLPTPVRVAGM